ncbi:MAG: UvrD-helicase domain-containing protein [Planctomycetota bacterium]|jgi:DNA helicase-2/ATP-dependent DNA helicase PcrA
MPETQQTNPAEIAAQRAIDEMMECIQVHQNFRLEAGAGAGKTYSLVKALRLIIDGQGTSLQLRSKQIACITYTNVATDEIISRTDGHPAVYASTIHAFCWDLVKSFQTFLRANVSELDSWSEKLEEAGGIGTRSIDYDLGYRRLSETHLFLHHDDLLTLAVALMEKPKFRQILTARFPILFIDEYQDTNADFANSLVQHFIAPGVGPLIGLFGDSWQKIYRDGIGLIEHENLKQIGKKANFRSVKIVVDVLNRIRSDLPQEVKDPEATGSVTAYHSNEWVGQRRVGNHWVGDLPVEVAHDYLEGLLKRLSDEGLDFAPQKTKILMLTHNILAAEQNYAQIVSAFRYNDSFIKKEDPHIAFLVDTVEPACSAFQNGRYGEMFATIGTHSDCIQSLEYKQAWASDMKLLIELRKTGTIGEVLDLLKETRRPRLPDTVQRTETKLANASPKDIEDSLTLSQIGKLRKVPYKELISLALFVNDHTPFSTKHGVKGAEFENVLVVLGRGWNQYNWNQFLEWFPNLFPANKVDSYERNRNLFYVASSRPKKRLTLLFTQELSDVALATLHSWFGKENVKPLTLG